MRIFKIDSTKPNVKDQIKYKCVLAFSSLFHLLQCLNEISKRKYLVGLRRSLTSFDNEGFVGGI